MTGFLDGLRQRAAAVPRRIAFPECGDERTMRAIGQLQSLGIVAPVIVRDATHSGVAAPVGVEVIDVDGNVRVREVGEALVKARAHKGVSADEAEKLARKALYFAAWLAGTGQVDGCVAGAVNTTGDVLRSALWLVGLAPGVRTVSSAFYMVVRP